MQLTEFITTNDKYDFFMIVSENSGKDKSENEVYELDEKSERNFANGQPKS